MSLRRTFVGMVGLVGLALAVAPLASGCGSSGSSSGGGGGTGTISMGVTDAPFPYSMVQSAVVTVGEVSIHGTQGASGGFAVIDSTIHTYDLVQLQQGKQAILTQAQVPAGEYDQIRLVVTQGTITLTDGRSFTLNVPSGDSSGIKVFLSPPITVTSGLTSQLVLDFDLAQSFSPVPNSATQASQVTDFQFHPVIRASAAASSGAIGGTVTTLAQPSQPIAGATVTVTKSDGSLTQTAQTATDGTYVVGFLPAGTYTVTVQSASGGTASAQNVTVTQANETTVNLKM